MRLEAWVDGVRFAGAQQLSKCQLLPSGISVGCLLHLHSFRSALNSPLIGSPPCRPTDKLHIWYIFPDNHPSIILGPKGDRGEMNDEMVWRSVIEGQNGVKVHDVMQGRAASFVYFDCHSLHHSLLPH